MHARVTKFKGTPQQIEAGIKYIREQIVPSTKAMTGYEAGYWLVDRANGKGLAITLFVSESALSRSEEAAAQTRAGATLATGAIIAGVERYEVIAQDHTEHAQPQESLMPQADARAIGGGGGGGGRIGTRKVLKK